MKQLRVAILGQGRSGRDIHGANLINMQEKFKIVAIVDPLEDRRNRAKMEYGCDTYADYHDIMKRDDIDLVVNATPSHLHVPITLEFLNKGFNVLCEKPLARRASEVDQLIEASKKSGKVLAIFQQSRYSAVFMKIREILDSGVLGRIVQISTRNNGFARRWDWQTLQEYNGGSLLNTGPHPMDQVLQLIGTDVMPKVTCIMDRANTFGDAEDFVKVILQAPGRPVVDYEISSCCAYPTFNYLVQGTNGTLIARGNHIDWKYFKPEEAPEQKLIRTPLSKEDGTPSYCTEELKWYEHSWDAPTDKQDVFTYGTGRLYSMLYDHIVEGKPLEVTPEQVRLQIAIMEECHRQCPLPRLSE